VQAELLTAHKKSRRNTCCFVIDNTEQMARTRGMRGHEGCDAFQISAVSHAVSTLSGAQHDSAQPTSAATQRSISCQDAKAAKQVDSELGVLGALARIWSQSSKNKCVHLRGTTLVIVLVVEVVISERLMFYRAQRELLSIYFIGHFLGGKPERNSVSRNCKSVSAAAHVTLHLLAQTLRTMRIDQCLNQ
jgi:hypothetical protein